MGSMKANQLLLFNKKITAVEACNYGLVTEVFQDANFANEVWPMLKKWSELPVKVFIDLNHSEYFIKRLNRSVILGIRVWCTVKN